MLFAFLGLVLFISLYSYVYCWINSLQFLVKWRECESNHIFTYLLLSHGCGPGTLNYNERVLLLWSNKISHKCHQMNTYFFEKLFVNPTLLVEFRFEKPAKKISKSLSSSKQELLILKSSLKIGRNQGEGHKFSIFFKNICTCICGWKVECLGFSRRSFIKKLKLRKMFRSRLVHP